MIVRVNLPQPFADYGIKFTGMVLVDGNGRLVYLLFKIPRVRDYYLGARQIHENPVGTLIAVSELENAVNGSFEPQRQAINSNPALRDGEQPLTTATVQELVYRARGFHPPERYDITNQLFPSTSHSERSGF